MNAVKTEAFPGYTVLIRTRNAGATLGSVIDRLTRQTVPPSEWVVVDSGSEDDTFDLARSVGATIVPYECGDDFNYSRALNLGVRHSTSEWLLILSADVILPHPNFMEVFFGEMFKSRSDFGYANFGQGDSQSFLAYEGDPEVLKVRWANFTGFNGLRNSCSLVRRLDVEREPFDESLRTAEDEAWAMMRFREGASGMELTQPCVHKLRGKGRVSAYERAYIILHILPFGKAFRHVAASIKWALKERGRNPIANQRVKDLVLYCLGRLESPRSHFEKFRASGGDPAQEGEKATD